MGSDLNISASTLYNYRFQSTLPRGERQPLYSITLLIFDFNPRSRVGSDNVDYAAAEAHPISIHAPAWGATPRRSQRSRRQSFQSTLPRGERLRLYRWSQRNFKFQSTLPRGARPSSNPVSMSIATFQSPLPRGERQQAWPFDMVVLDISIHAPAWGATAFDLVRLHKYGISIHAPAWGATSTPARLFLPLKDFNPRSRVGSDFAPYTKTCMALYFNPRSRVGSDKSGEQP